MQSGAQGSVDRKHHERAGYLSIEELKGVPAQPPKEGCPRLVHAEREEARSAPDQEGGAESESGRKHFHLMIAELSKTEAIRTNFPDLVKFGARLVDSASPNISKVGVSTDHLTEVLRKLPSEQLRLAFGELSNSISTNTSYFREFNSLGITNELQNGFKAGALGVRIKFTGDRQVESGGEDLGASAQYNSRTNEATVEGHAAAAPELWARLATDGRLPDQIEFIHHELIHSLQRGGSLSRVSRAGIAIGSSIGVGLSASLFGASFGVQLPLQVATYFAAAYAIDRFCGAVDRSEGCAAGRAIRELQAYLATEESPSIAREPRSPMEHVMHISMQIGAEVPQLRQDPNSDERVMLVSQGRMVAAGMAVVGAGAQLAALRLLGVSHQDLGKLLSKAEFDPRTAGFPTLSAKERAVRQELGLQDDALYTKTLQALDFKRKVENTEARQQACRIARSALIQFGIELGSKESGVLG